LSDGELEELELSAAALSLAGLERLEQPPDALISRLQSAARAQLAQAGDRSVPSVAANAAPRPRGWALALTGWAAAAALLAILLLRDRPEPERTSAERRAALLADAPDSLRVDWTAGQDPLAGRLTGDVVWSGARQEGYMRFRDLPANDPTRQQYQLWIFDKSREDWEAKPVDGGVFDVGHDGETVVSIEPKLEVREAALFAVTLEPAGGVVV
jgi:hypothetical protein